MGRIGRFFVRKGGYIYQRDWVGVYIMLSEASRQLAPREKNKIYKNNQNAPIESNFLDALLGLY